MQLEVIPTHLTLAQIFDALSYYSDHQAQINGYIERNRISEDLIYPSVKNLDQAIRREIVYQ